MPSPSLPKVIFLDAVGTLFGIAGSVGQIYRNIALQHGVEADAEELNQAFFRTFKAAPPMAFPGVDANQIPNLEFLWWRRLGQQTFSSAGVLDQFVDFDSFFADLYAHFATADPWFVYPEVLSTLQQWRRWGVELGIISNFDSRLYRVLDNLGLSDYFQSITISSEVGAAKPNPLIFATALQKHGCEPSQAWHVGDSKTDDRQGARGVGLRGIWVQRQNPLAP
jgi:putative hydrolase of the HAD superfamily